MTAIAAIGGLWLAFLAPSAQAAAPAASAVSATDLQGVSALLLGTVNPEGEATTYHFEYGSQGPCDSNPCASTPAVSAGQDNTDHLARAAISGLTPNTAYDFRLVASNGSGSDSAAGTFTTTAGFGFLAGKNGFAAAAITNAGGGTATLAGSHPYQLNLGLGFNLGGKFEGQPSADFPDGDLRDLQIQLPPGFLLNPNSIDKCTQAQFHVPRPTPTTVPAGFPASPFVPSLSGENCPIRSQVGTVEVRTSLDTAHSQLPDGSVRRFGVFNLTPPPGVLGQIGFSPFGVPIVFNLVLRPDESHSYAIALEAQNVPQELSIHGFGLQLWGVPWDGSGKFIRDELPGTSHDTERGDCLYQVPEKNSSGTTLPPAECPSEPPRSCDPAKETCPPKPTFPPLAYLTLPTQCAGQLSFTAGANAWQQPATVSSSAQNLNSLGNPTPIGDCLSLNFNPQPLGLLTDNKASSASGFNFRLTNDNAAFSDPVGRVLTEARKAVVTLPKGVTLNPSLGAGLGVCTPAQYAAETDQSPQGAGCPNGSKIGDFSVTTPLFAGQIDGAIYLAEPDDPATLTPGAENPFDTLVGIYLVAKSPERGVLVKLAGKLVPDPGTGQLTATFDGLPELPYTDLDLTFKTGQRAPLITPPSCGQAPTQIDLSPWSGGADLISSSPSPIVRGIGGAPCPSGTPPFNPGVVTGGVNANVGSYTPYYVHLSRSDDQQEITSYSLVLPKGITGKLAGIPFCPEADIEAARHNNGYAEAANSSCPEASLVGHTLTGYGVGSALTYASGRVYLAGPYHGAPLSLVTVNSATVGPFDLGTIVIRSAFQVDEHTAQLRIDSKASDPIPHIIDGIPLHLRDVRIYMDRPQFTHNPSSCEPSQLDSTLTGSGADFANPSDDSTATVSEHFQLLNCLTLGFQPKLGLVLHGGTKQNDYPELHATFASRGPKDTNLKNMAVVIPPQMFVAQNHIRGICTRAQFDANQCPPDSIYGHATAETLLFDEPLTGNVYLRSNPARSLPDLVASLYAGAVHIVVDGEIGPAHNGGVLTQFTNLPDAPIDRFSMTLYGGKRGLLVNSTDICAHPPLASVKALGQNNIGAVFTTRLRGRCHQARHHRKRHRHRRYHRRARSHPRHPVR